MSASAASHQPVELHNSASAASSASRSSLEQQTETQAAAMRENRVSHSRLLCSSASLTASEDDLEVLLLLSDAHSFILEDELEERGPRLLPAQLQLSVESTSAIADE